MMMNSLFILQNIKEEKMKEVKIGSTIIMEVLETGALFTKTIEYQKGEWKPKSGNAVYKEQEYKYDVEPQKIESNVITNLSPLGSALLGKSVGDVVKVKKLSYKIIEIK